MAGEQFRNPTSTSSETRPTKRFKNPTPEKTRSKNTFKQQQAVAVENIETYRLLRQAGFDERVAAKLAVLPAERIERQITWLDHRAPRDNRLGMLRRAIEEDWEQPPAAKREEEQQQARLRQQLRQAQEEAEYAAENMQKRERRQHREQLLNHWHGLSREQRLHYLQVAIEQAGSEFDRSRLRRNQDLRNPLPQVLLVMEADLAVVPTS